MINSKSSFIARRVTRRRFAQSTRRCIGLERLERRTVFASDLGADLESQLFACTANEMQPQAVVQPITESQAQSDLASSIYQASTPSILTEIASSTVSLVNGDLITIEVPTSSFDYLQLSGRYVLTYSYAQNYFSDTDDQALQANAFRSIAQSSAIDSWSANTRGSVDNSLVARSRSSEQESAALENQVQASDRTAVLASLTATTDFDATIRVFENSQVDSGVGSGQFDFGARQLPSEIRIEPNLTNATVLPDPGPIITRTIVVNRQADGLVLEEQPTKQFGPAKPDSSELLVSVSSSNGPNTTPTSAPASSQTSVTKPTRPTVTIKTIDISQMRRNDAARPWLRSTVIQNPARQHDFGFAKKTTIATSNSTTPVPNGASRPEKSARWNSRVSATRLQPVELLLAPHELEAEKVAVLDGKPAIATDVAMSSYSDASLIDRLGDEVFIDWLNASGLGIQTASTRSEEPSKSSTSAIHGSEAWLMAMATEMQRIAHYPPANANRDSWKSLVRSASESAAGQAFLATLSTIAVQHKEMNGFDSKSAWEFVTRPKLSSRT